MTTKQKEQILTDLLCRKDVHNMITAPGHILSSYKGISPDEVNDCFRVLESDKCIAINRADYPDDDCIGWIAILPNGLTYFERRKEANRQIRRSWWQIMLGGVAGSGLTLFIEHVLLK